jgi:hypothetical protein
VTTATGRSAAGRASARVVRPGRGKPAFGAPPAAAGVGWVPTHGAAPLANALETPAES